MNSFFEPAQSYLLQLTGDPVAARQMALQLRENLRQQQSSALAYLDTFFVFAVLSIPLVAFVFMMKRSVAQRVRTRRQSDRVIKPPRRMRQRCVHLP